MEGGLYQHGLNQRGKSNLDRPPTGYKKEVVGKKTHKCMLGIKCWKVLMMADLEELETATTRGRLSGWRGKGKR